MIGRLLTLGTQGFLRNMGQSTPLEMNRLARFKGSSAAVRNVDLRKKPKTLNQKLKKLKKNPGYAHVTNLKKFDWRQEDLTFPLSVPLKHRVMYRPSKDKITPLPTSTSDILNFKRMTGNEILLNLRNAAHFRDQEVVEAFRNLYLQPNIKEHDWNNHELFQNLVQRVTKHISEFSASDIAELIRYFDRLDLKDEKFWKGVAARFTAIHPSLKGRHFAAFFVNLMKRPETDEALKLELAKLLPRELWRFNPKETAEAFKLIVDHDMLSEHLWHNHFHLIFWRKSLWLGLPNFALIIRYMVKIDYLQELAWWNENFLPAIDYYLHGAYDVAVLEELNLALHELHDAAIEIEVDSYQKKLKERVIYLQTQYLAEKNNTFVNMVKSDLQYFREKVRAEREAQALTGQKA